MAGVVVGETIGAVAIADDEELDEAEEGSGVTVAGIVLVLGDFLHEPGEPEIGEVDAVEGFEFLPEVFFQRGAVADVRTVFVLQALELANETGFEMLLPEDGTGRVRPWNIRSI